MVLFTDLADNKKRHPRHLIESITIQAMWLYESENMP